jgi:RNA polymerase sigma-70 factor (ECF subfamily)
MGLKNKILAQVKKGKEKAFKQVFTIYYPRLEKYASHFIANSQEAEDIVQDVFVQVWENREALKIDSNFDSYLFTLVRNRCLNALKKHSVEQKFIDKIQARSEELYYISFGMDDEFLPIEILLHQELEKIIVEMPERCQSVFRLKWFEGKKIREISEIMGISTTMVDKHLAKGMEIMRQKMSPEMFLVLYLMLMGPSL